MKARVLHVALVAVVGAIVYSNSLSGPFLFDDQSAILLNPRIRHLWPPMDVLAPSAHGVVANRPIVNLSFAINYAIGEFSVRGYHITNVALHLAASLLLFLLIRTTLAAPLLRGRFLGHADGIALGGALIWMVHPLQTDAVNYVTQRSELLMGLCYLLTVFCAVHAMGSATPKRWYLAAIASCLLGAGSKESIATAPLMVILYDRVFFFRSLKDAWRERGMLYGGLALTWLTLAVTVSSRGNTAGFGAGVSVWTYLLNQALMISQYLKLTVWPYDLVLDYGIPRALSLMDVLPQALLVVSLLLLTAFALVRRPLLGFVGAWFFMTLAPASSFIPIASEVGAERRMYLPLAAIAVLAALAVYAVAARFFPRRLQSLAGVMTALLVVWLSSATFQRNQDYVSGVTLLRTSVDRWPHGRARFNLAYELRVAGKKDEATVQLRAAALDTPQAQYLLASDMYDRGEFDAAIRELQAFIGRKGTLAADVVTARNLLGLALAQQGKMDLAIAELQSLLSTNPDNPDLHGNLAFLFLQQREFERAREHYEGYLRHRQGSAFIWTGLGTALAELGRSEDAIGAYRQALIVDPDYPEARVRLARLGTPGKPGQ
ncbi:MAG TPA: tetratricopeptide repeat protein [Vicinamibacterales bacterium]|nr:tetratricopeptide repeat protein [Vicinamibacterales bacterium]